jgi:ABC-2 type transport system permease protein
MRALSKLIYKDFLVMIRDRGGLAMLFLMPMTLVLIMTSLQNNTFNAINESGIELILLNSDTDTLGTAIENEILHAGFFNVHKKIKGNVPTEQMIKDEVAQGNYQIGVVIPSNATQRIRESVKSSVEHIFAGDSSAGHAADSIFIKLYVDPATKNSLRSSLQGSVREYAARVESRIVLNELTNEINKRFVMPVSNLNLIKQELVFYKEEYVAEDNKTVLPNSVQHNVPAWTLFAMFFMVIPFASAMIKEREEGGLARLLTMPCSYSTIMFSRIVVNLAVCLLQFTLIMIMGIYLFPLFGLPALDTGGRIISLSVMAVTTALAAIGYGISVGTIARTHQQAAVFASISVVILAAIGGIWVPVFIMPPFLRHLSIVSPLNWGLKGFYDILVRHAQLADVIHYGIWMMLFSAGCLIVALLYQSLKRESN